MELLGHAFRVVSNLRELDSGKGQVADDEHNTNGHLMKLYITSVVGLPIPDPMKTRGQINQWELSINFVVALVEGRCTKNFMVERNQKVEGRTSLLNQTFVL